MRKIALKAILLIIVTMTISCSDLAEKGNVKKSMEPNVNFSFDKEIGLFELTKKWHSPVLEDTAWYYKDSLRQQLIFLNTLIEKNGVIKINQSISYNSNNKYDTSNSYFFDINSINENINLLVASMLNDSIYLIIGEIDSNYQNSGSVDTFIVNNGKLSIPDKYYYKRGRIGILEEIGKDTFRGKEMYVPSKYLEDNFYKTTK